MKRKSVDALFMAAPVLNKSESRLNVPVGVHLLMTIALSSCAFLVRDGRWISTMIVVNLLWMMVCRVPWRQLKRLVRPFVMQTLLLLLLYGFKQGQQGVVPAAQVSLQLMLTLMPPIVLSWCVPPSHMARTFSRWMPDQAAFVLAASLHFFPLVLGEWRILYQAQQLRGVPLAWKQLLQPWKWSLVMRCLVVPAVVIAMSLAHEIALAARARNFTNGPRSCWMEEQ